jgi:hypothetical protein
MYYDLECIRLAKHFLLNETPIMQTPDKVVYLAQRIYDSVEAEIERMRVANGEHRRARRE